MKAVIYRAPEKFEVTEIPKPEVGQGDVLIRVKACGICKTDVHIHRGKFIATFPLTPGHEFAGEVAQVGEGVIDFKPGDRVTADNAYPCGNCYYCRQNKPLYCENFYSLGCNAPGGFADYVLVRSEKVFKISENLSFEEAAFTEPTACVVHSMDVAKIEPGSRVLVLGAGPAGLILSQVVKRCGAGELVVAAPTESKLNIARELGADRVVRIQRSDLIANREELLGHDKYGFDVVFDATGSARVTEQCPELLKFGGKLIVFGVPGEEERISISPYDIYRREIKIIGSFAQVNCFPRALSFLESGSISVKGLITCEFPLDEFAEALNVLMFEREALKVIIKP